MGGPFDPSKMSAAIKYRRRKRIRADEHREDSCVSNEEPPEIGRHVVAESCLQHLDRKLKTQVFLDVGQADFSYSTCNFCGLFYARGHAEDEKLHLAFHMNFLRGVPFNGWQKERVITCFDKKEERVILVLASDPLQHQLKIKDVMKVMEKDLELEPGSLPFNGCKVYLYISSRKVVGCVIAEPISQAYSNLVENSRTKIVTKLQVQDDESPTPVEPCNLNKTNRNSRTLVFGNIKFKREVLQKTCKTEKTSRNDAVCSEPLPAVCGVRGLWVLRKERRRGIATRLLDAMRTSFVYGLAIDKSQCAFLQPTQDGQAFAATYCKPNKFLFYF